MTLLTPFAFAFVTAANMGQSAACDQRITMTKLADHLTHDGRYAHATAHVSGCSLIVEYTYKWNCTIKPGRPKIVRYKFDLNFVANIEVVDSAVNGSKTIRFRAPSNDAKTIVRFAQNRSRIMKEAYRKYPLKHQAEEREEYISRNWTEFSRQAGSPGIKSIQFCGGRKETNSGLSSFGFTVAASKVDRWVRALKQYGSSYCAKS